MNDLGVVQVGHELVLSFKAPQLAADGRRLTKPIEVEIFREIQPQGAAAPKALMASKPWVSLKSQDLSRIVSGGEITYRDPLSSAEFARSTGSLYSFVVITLTRSFRGHPRESAPSNVAQTRILRVAPPVKDLQVVQTRQTLNLRWSPPQETLNGTSLPTLSGYRVYRGEEARPGVFIMVAKTRSPSYQDTHFHFGTAYSYKVRAVFTAGGYTAETADSNPVEIIPRPTFPPPPPIGLTAVFTGKAVQLIWKPEVTPDIAGYNIYRQALDQPARRLNHQLLRTPVFTDSAVTQGIRYTYWVTAVDLEHNESKTSSEASVETR